MADNNEYFIPEKYSQQSICEARMKGTRNRNSRRGKNSTVGEAARTTPTEEFAKMWFGWGGSFFSSCKSGSKSVPAKWRREFAYLLTRPLPDAEKELAEHMNLEPEGRTLLRQFLSGGQPTGKNKKLINPDVVRAAIGYIAFIPKCYSPVQVCRSPSDTQPVVEPSGESRVTDTVVEVEELREDVAGVDEMTPRRIPYLDNAADFIARDEVIQDLHKHFGAAKGQPPIVCQVVHGMSGAGKTQIALRYAHRYVTEYDGVFWVTADTRTQMLDDYGKCAEAVGLPITISTSDSAAQARAFVRWLETSRSRPWLLILDNVDDPKVLDDMLPTSGKGRLLITSQFSLWENQFRSVHVTEFGPEMAVRLLLTRSGQKDEQGAADLAAELGYLPLALAQVAAFLKLTSESFENYLELFRRIQPSEEVRARLLSGGSAPPTYKYTVYRALEMAMKRIQSSEAEDLLGLLACLAPNPVPKPLLTSERPLQVTTAIEVLARYSLIRVGPTYVEVHRLTQEVARDLMDLTRRKARIEHAVQLLDDGFPQANDEQYNWRVCEELHPHADKAGNLALSYRVATDRIWALFHRLSVFDHLRGRLAEAKKRYDSILPVAEAEQLEVQRLLSAADRRFSNEGDGEPILEGSLQERSDRLAALFDNLGLLCRDLGLLDDAKKYHLRAISIQEQVYGPDCAAVLLSKSNLALVYKASGALGLARGCLMLVLDAQLKLFPRPHPAQARTRGNLGTVNRCLGYLGDARADQLDALRDLELSFGDKHSEVATALINLGMVEWQLGIQTANEHLTRAFQMLEEAYGPKHPSTGVALYNLGLIAQQNDPEVAYKHAFRAVSIFAETLGEQHTKTIKATLLAYKTRPHA